jgi:Uncharacterised nucleotidyltransferase
MALDIVDELHTLIDALAREQIDYAVCGGLALAILGHPRMTKDIDLLVRTDDVQRVRELARLQGFDIPARVMTFGLRTGNPHTVQRVSKLDPETQNLLPLDLLHVEPLFEGVWSGRLVAPWRGRTIQVVSREGLATMKRMAGRPQDLADIAVLEGANEDE